MSYVIYTDGSHSKGKGGWAAIVLNGNPEPVVISGRAEGVTNNQMELMAAIEGINSTPTGSEVVLMTDSAYVGNAIERGWIERWENQNWKTSNGEPVKNVDQWRQLAGALKDRDVTVTKIKAHSGDYWNDKADKIARARMIGTELVEGAYSGDPILKKEIARLWATAHEAGYLEEGMRMMMGEYGIVSTKDITSGIYDEILNKASSKVLAKMFNGRAKR
jgi:ribonuclease HI